MSLSILSFLAGLLSVLAPCVLPVLPVILGGSLGSSNWRKPLTIILSTGLFITIFTVALKASTALIDIPQSVRTTISAVIIMLYGLTLAFPHAREVVSLKLGLYKANQLADSAKSQGGFWGDVLLGASLGPIFASCSPTYTLLLSTIFPQSFAQGAIYTIIYSLGFALGLGVIAYGGRSLINHLLGVANPNGRFKKVLGGILILTGILIISGWMKKLEASLLDTGFSTINSIEQQFIPSSASTQALSQTSGGSGSMTQYTGGVYMKYDDTKLASLTGDIVIFFHADWCPTCRQAEQSFAQSGIPAGLTILKANFDTDYELRKKYNILSQTSYVYIKNDGTMIKRWIGGTTIETIIEKVNEVKQRQTSPLSVKTGSNITEVAYFAGGCFWCMEGPFESLEGVKNVTNGYIGGSASDASYSIVSQGSTTHREAIQVLYDPALIDYKQLLELYRTQIDPTDAGGQFADRGYQYTTAIYYTSPQQQALAQQSKNKLQQSKKFTKPIATLIESAPSFYPAEEYHQDYYKKNSLQYNAYKKGSGREDFIKTNQSQEQHTTRSKASSRRDRKPKDASQLTASQRAILFEGGTEPPFNNAYRDNHEAGIYVDVIDGTPLFSSIDKFDSGTGRPSFTKPIDQKLVDPHTDTSDNMTRTEIKSSSSNGHLGHVFDDGPVASGGNRYCINSAALEFIPVDQLEEQGYGEYLSLFK